MEKGKKRFLIAAVLITVIAVTAIITYTMTIHKLNSGEIYLREENYAELMQYYEMKNVRSIIDAEYAVELEETQGEKLIDGAISGMMQSLEDGYSAFYTVDDYKAYFDEDLDGSSIAQGMMLEIGEAGSYPIIKRVFAETAAYDAGVIAGETLLTVDGIPMCNMDINIVLGYLRGVEGTGVVLETTDGSEIKKYSLVRNDAQAQLVFTDTINEQVGYISIVEFTGKCAQDLQVALESMAKEQVEAVVLDLRGVSGGFISEAVECADLLLKDGLIATSVSRGQENMRWESDEETVSQLPIAILTDHQTSGVAEVFAAALQAHGRCKVVGQNTKGSAAATTMFKVPSSGNVVKLVTAFYRDPDGQQIHGNGIVVDVVLEMGDGSLQANAQLLEQAAQQLIAQTGTAE